MSKLTMDQENYFDSLILKYIVEPLAPIVYKLGIKPNLLTLIGLISSLTAIYNLSKYRIYLFSLYFIISQIFDVFDGYLARRYNMSSKFGDYFDHISDTIKTISLFYILFIKYDLGHSKILIIMFIILLILLLVFVGYQEKISQYDNHNETLKMNCIFCYGDPEIYIKKFKYFGSGTFIIMCILVSHYLYYKKIKMKIPIITQNE